MINGENKIRFTVFDDTNGEWEDTPDEMFAIMGDGTKLIISKSHEEVRQCFTGPWIEPLYTITRFKPDSRYHILAEPTE